MEKVKKIGRPETDKPYRLNRVRVSQVEDMLERILRKVHPNNPMRGIIQQELAELRMRELQKVQKRLL